MSLHLEFEPQTKGRTVMQYIINGDVVTADRYDRELTDNFNCGIAYTETVTDDTTTMEYED